MEATIVFFSDYEDQGVYIDGQLNSDLQNFFFSLSDKSRKEKDVMEYDKDNVLLVFESLDIPVVKREADFTWFQSVKNTFPPNLDEIIWLQEDNLTWREKNILEFTDDQYKSLSTLREDEYFNGVRGHLEEMEPEKDEEGNISFILPFYPGYKNPELTQGHATKFTIDKEGNVSETLLENYNEEQIEE